MQQPRTTTVVARSAPNRLLSKGHSEQDALDEQCDLGMRRAFQAT
jgi:hypothetical protein